ncbi:MAG: hypothetical protein CVU56_21700 [Deltaproteobacteria bacterium HGW-Deltaproteobacteria-14]|jgi:hypothetical protein|nr:MAG: hypothetical protein CVU56_21700 [Deltaproteobacteria bacterium HGW-Deltaproteobacteria-14]
MPDVDPACARPSLRPRLEGRGRVRGLALAASLALGLLASACGESPEARCGDAYEHLLSIGRRTHDAGLRTRFIKACVEAWDAKKVACVQSAATPDEALACEWFKKRPG